MLCIKIDAISELLYRVFDKVKYKNNSMVGM